MPKSVSARPADTRIVRRVGWAVLALLFLMPVLAMHITAEVHWTMGDFAVFGALLLMIGLGCDLAVRRLDTWSARLGWAVTLGTAALLVLVNGAVGLIGSEQADANALFGVVLAVIAVGIGVTRARTRPMAAVLGAAAITQLAVVGVVLLADLVHAVERTSRDALVSGLGFAGLWLLAAYLFRRAER